MKKKLFDILVELFHCYWWALLLVGIGFIIAYKYVAPPPPRHITIATGAENGGYHRFGMRLKTALEQKGLSVTLKPTAGTIENLRLLSDPNSGVTVAFGQGGVERFYTGDKEMIRGLGSMFYEPLWFFYRKDSDFKNFGDLKHMKVAMGKDGSGTQMLGEVLLRENNIPESSWVRIGSVDAIKALNENKVQALFLVAPVEDPVERHKPHPDVYRLMADTNIALFGARRAQAYVSRLPHLAVVTIGEGLLDLEKDYPSRPLTLVSPYGTMNCREDLDGAIAFLLLQTCKELQEQGGWLEKPGEFPSKAGVTFPLLPEARQFYDKGPSFFYKIFPFWVANMVNRLWIMLIPLITLVIPSAKLAVPAYRWRFRRKIATKYRVLLAIDDKIVDGTILKDIDSHIAKLLEYEDELAKMYIPIMFAGDYYQLRSHVRYLRRRLHEIKAAHAEKPSEKS